MANTPNLDLENINVLLDTDSAYNQLVTEIIPKINSNNLKIDGLPNNFIPSSQKGVANGIATLGSDGIIPKGQLPIDSGSVQRVTDIIARDAITNLYDNKLVFVTDASADTTVTAGWAMYIYSTASLSWTKIVDAESLDLQLTWDNITNKPTAFPPDTHTHEQIQTNADNITNLQNNKVDKITGSRLVSETEITVFNDKYSKVEVDNKLSALETKIDWKEAVNTYADIATTYPTPIDGWTVNVKDTDYTYRYNGIEWIPISANVIPKATTSVDGLMSKEDKAQVEQNKTDILSAKTTLGSVAMTTTAQTVTGAINELDADIGNKSTLATTDKSNLVNAVNETKTLINDLIPDFLATTRFKIGYFTRNMTLGTGTQAVTGLGFSPKAVIFLATIQGTAVGMMSIGFDTKIAAKVLYDYHNVSANTYNIADHSIAMRPIGSNSYNGKIETLDEDGFTLQWSLVGSVSGIVSVQYLAFM